MTRGNDGTKRNDLPGPHPRVRPSGGRSSPGTKPISSVLLGHHRGRRSKRLRFPRRTCRERRGDARLSAPTELRRRVSLSKGDIFQPDQPRASASCSDPTGNPLGPRKHGSAPALTQHILSGTHESMERTGWAAPTVLIHDEDPFPPGGISLAHKGLKLRNPVCAPRRGRSGFCSPAYEMSAPASLSLDAAEETHSSPN